jgi:hypothetical protein
MLGSTIQLLQVVVSSRLTGVPYPRRCRSVRPANERLRFLGAAQDLDDVDDPACVDIGHAS